MLEYQEVIEGNFKKKFNVTVEKLNDEDDQY